MKYFLNCIVYYFSSELKNLKEKCLMILQRFYESKGHQKKQIQAGG